MNTKFNKFIFGLCVCCGLLSCSDFFDQDPDHIIFAEENHLSNATDTIYSVTGILNKLQAIGDRTVLLGEVRGDLVRPHRLTWRGAWRSGRHHQLCQ